MTFNLTANRCKALWLCGGLNMILDDSIGSENPYEASAGPTYSQVNA